MKRKPLTAEQREAKREYMRRYMASPRGKATQAKYRQTSAGLNTFVRRTRRDPRTYTDFILWNMSESELA